MLKLTGPSGKRISLRVEQIFEISTVRGQTVIGGWANDRSFRLRVKESVNAVWGLHAKYIQEQANSNGMDKSRKYQLPGQNCAV